MEQNMSNLEVRKPRSISIPDADIQDVLNWKLIQYQDNGIPIDVLSDYMAKGIDEIESKKNELENYKKMIDNEIKTLKEHSKIAKTECAKFMTENGVDRLTGIEVSSITLTKPIEEKQEEVEKKIFICDLTKQEINDFLVMQNMARYETTKSTKITAAVDQMIKINKRRKPKE